MKRLLSLLVVFFCFQEAQSQVLMSLIFGDKLNSPNIEFGLEGGANFSTISNQTGADYRTDFNLGFYFDFNLKNPSWIFNTGVIVKSSMGAEGLPVYSLNDANLDATFSDGSVSRKISYFNVPLMIKYKFDNNIYVKAGTQLGLLSRAVDIFSQDYNGEDVEYKNNIRDKIHVIDAGLTFGAGYRLKTGKYGMNLGLQYYYGLVPLLKGDNSPIQYNRSLYVTAGLPIGKGKAAKRAAEKKALESKETLPN
ncbi:porin family protein [Flavobacterium aquicola]|uniref:Outer membrane protein with beta-barrel domain n=1 Tax=Flavobacterium aquicola TaxID=1682742 RepID=A0A3E0E1H9_9FLAO|nr:porin family protein [Flavobacterium aquicola]REG91189.1 outer membrane protein with beta-barrel domain [Flavobacterium aquicola]